MMWRAGPLWTTGATGRAQAFSRTGPGGARLHPGTRRRTVRPREPLEAARDRLYVNYPEIRGGPGWSCRNARRWTSTW
jgi:hypothetical protein